MYKIANQAWKDPYGPFHFLLFIYDTTLCHTCHAILKNVLFTRGYTLLFARELLLIYPVHY